jgi:Uma2 family endonuclease
MSATSPAVVLESGDHLTREEFHRRYCARPDIKKAELIEGVVYVAPPRISHTLHAEPHAQIVGWLGICMMMHSGLHLADSTTIILDDLNEVQPDAILWREESGGPHVNDDDYLVGAPQLVAEVAASPVSIDLHAKLRAYERNGVLEYVVWRTVDGAIDWFAREGDHFVLVEPDAQGVIESRVFPGLRLNVAKMLAGDIHGVLAELGAPGQSAETEPAS